MAAQLDGSILLPAITDLRMSGCRFDRKQPGKPGGRIAGVRRRLALDDGLALRVAHQYQFVMPVVEQRGNIELDGDRILALLGNQQRECAGVVLIFENELVLEIMPGRKKADDRAAHEREQSGERYC